MSSHTQPGAARSPDPSGSGTRQPAFLRPLPGERYEPAADSGRTIAVTRREIAAIRDDEVLSRLFPLMDSGEEHNAGPTTAVGVRLGHFIIEECIGRGGMGGVFRAVDERLNRVVALKILAPSSARDAAAVERFRNEGQAAARLDHENIARVYYIGDDQGVPFIAFEFVRGTNVRDIILQKGMLPPEEAVNYTLQIAQALRHTQAARVVHRDIKPSNIIITPSGQAKLVDLGLARQEQSEPARELTVPGTTLGTFDYIAPEQARDPRCVDVRTDIYSLGCTLYHMLTGQPPFPQGTIIEKVVEHHRDAPPDPALRNPLVTPQLSQIVRTMMASNPDDRFSGPEALIVELSQVAAALGLRPAHADNFVWTRPIFERQPGFFEANKGWLLTVALLLLIAAVIEQWPFGWQTASESVGAETVNQPGDSGSRHPKIADDLPPTDVSPKATAASAPPSPERERLNGMRNGLTALNLSTGSIDVADETSREAPAAPEDPLAVDNTATNAARIRRMEADAVVRNIDQLNSPIPDRRAPPTGNRPELSSAVTPPFLVLDSQGGGNQAYDTLSEACRDAPSGAVIELCFDGELPAPQPPVRVQDKRITIRAQQGRNPVLEFQPRADQPQGASTRMVQVSGGGLVLQDVDLRLPVPSGRYERWAMFSLVQAQKLQLERVSIVVTNPYRQSAAVVEFVQPPGDDPSAMMPGSMQPGPAVLDWQDCLVRAECDFIASQTLDPADMRLTNVALGSRGWLARIEGQVASRGRTSADDRRLAIHLQNVTALLYEGVIFTDTGADEYREFSPIKLDCDHSALIVRPERPLIVMRGQQEISALKRRLTWGSRASVVDATGPVWEIFELFEGLGSEFGFQELGLSSQQVIETDLLREPLLWDEARFASLPAAAFELRPLGSGSARTATTGVRFDDPMPSADDIATANGSRNGPAAP